MDARDDDQGLRGGFMIDGNGEQAQFDWRRCFDLGTRPDEGDRPVRKNILTMDESDVKIISTHGMTGSTYHTYNMHDIDEKHNIYHLHYTLNTCIIYQSNKAHHVCNIHDKRIFENIDGNRELAEA